MKFYNWKQDAIKDGRGFLVTVGTFSAPVAGGGASTIVDLDRPRVLISVPALTSIIPIRLNIQCQLPLIANDSEESEIIIGSDKDAVWNTVGGCTSETPINLKTTHTRTSACTCKSVFSGNITVSPALDYELARAVKIADIGGTAASQAWGLLECNYEPETSLIMDGPCMLLGYWGGSVATTGFAQFEWLEFLTAEFV